MGMEFLAFYDQLFADLPADYQQHYEVLFDIIQHAEIADTQFKLGKWVRSELLNGMRDLRWLVH